MTETPNKMASLERKVADQMILALQTSGTGWKKHWATPRAAQNAITGHVYTGSNVFMAGMEMMLRGITDPRFMTFKQALAAGGGVRKGAKGIPIVYYSTFQRETAEGDTKSCGFAKVSHVFAVADIEGADIDALPELNLLPHQRDEAVEAYFHACKVPLFEGQQAFYRPGDDTITMPPLGLFRAADVTRAEDFYYGTLLHELMHATGHKSRMNRDLTHGNRTAEYAREELVAEIGSVMLGQRLGLQIEPRADNVSYVKGWIRLLQDKPRTIFEAASAASKGMAWIEAQQPQAVKEAA